MKQRRLIAAVELPLAWMFLLSVVADSSLAESTVGRPMS